MTKDEAIVLLKETCNTGDQECDHMRADAILCELLISLDYREVVKEWEKIDKWYA